MKSDDVEGLLEYVLKELKTTHRTTKYNWEAVMDFVKKHKVVTSRQVREFMKLPKTKQQMVYSWLERNVAGEANEDLTDIVWDDKSKPLLRLKVSGAVCYAALDVARAEATRRTSGKAVK